MPTVFQGDHSGAAMEPEARVKSFIADYLLAHQQLHAENFTDRVQDQFNRWNSLITNLDAEHGINRGCMALARVIHGDSPHVPEAEPIVSIREEQGKVYVETCVKDSLDHYYEYELWQSNGDWRIGKIREFLDPADALLMTDRDRSRFTNPPTLPLRGLPAEDSNANGDLIFASGRQVRLDDRTSSIEVRPVGPLCVTTGRLVVGDLGYDTRVLGVIGQSVPPGEYAADVAIAFNRVAALRVRFSNEAVDKWLPADHNSGKSTSYVVGVDAGNVAIMDLAAIMTVKSRDKERAFETYAQNQTSRYSMLALVRANDGVISDSGWGDGGYPVYWGVDANRQPVVLVVDFMLLPRLNPETAGVGCAPRTRHT
jgi:hypothetical protein